MGQTAFIHGFLGHPSDWNIVRQQLGGDSQSLAIPRAAGWDDAVESVLDGLPKHVDLVGYSMGGRIALGCAIVAPEKVRRLVVVSASPGINESDRPERLRRDLELSSTLRNCSTTTERHAFLDEWYRQQVFTGLTESEIAKLIQRRSGIDVNQMADLIETLSVAKQPDYRDALRSIAPDILVVAGNRDSKYAAMARSVARLSSRISCEIIPNCGHAIPFEQPEALAATIGRFLSD